MKYSKLFIVFFIMVLLLWSIPAVYARRERDAKRIEKLEVQLNNNAYDIRVKAVEQLVNMGTTEAINVLIGILEKGKFSEWGKVFKPLCEMEDEAFFVFEEVLMREDVKSGARVLAASALGQKANKGNKEAINILIDALYSENSITIREAVESLGRVERDLLSKQLILRLMNNGLFEGIDWSSGIPVIKVFKRKDIGEGDKIVAALAVGNLGKIDVLIKALEEGYFEDPGIVINILGKKGGDNVIDVLEEVLEGKKYSDDVNARKEAVLALKEISGYDKVSVLEKVLKNDESEAVKLAVVSALREIGSNDAISVLAKVFERDESNKVKLKAIFHLSLLANKDNEKAREVLEKISKRDDEIGEAAKEVIAGFQRR